jgi:predicted dehydrogenase
MSHTTRRTFLQQTAVGLAGAAALGSVRTAYADSERQGGASQTLRFGLIGCGGRGTHVADIFCGNENVQLAYLCDADQNRLEAAAQHFSGQAPKPVKDLRQVLDDKEVDAVLVATPDHWHSPAAILACEAGKHVYVEKPCSHNVREGRLLVEAARRKNCIVQHGTQVRSTAMMQQGVQMLREGAIGTVLASKAWNIQRRGSIGRQQPSQPPAALDYDLWVGPAPMIPYQENRTHNGWHWWHHFGTGDMGNDGVHDIDYARWGLGVETHPSEITAAGGKFFFDDDQEFPDTQQVTFVYPGDGKPGSQRMLIYEQRLWSSSYPYNVDSGAEFYGTAGIMFLSRRGKIQVRNEKNESLDVKIEPEAQNEVAHVANFIDSVRNGGKPNAEIEIGHLTASLCHLGNMATRLRRTLNFDPQSEQIVGDDEANQLVRRSYREHWGTPKNV